MRTYVFPSLVLLGACSGPMPEPPVEEPAPVEVHVPCRARDAQRRAYFGDLHVHTSYSFDVYGFDVRVTPADSWPPLKTGEPKYIARSAAPA